MADTLPDIPLPANTWVDLYAASLITPGTRIIASNKGASTITLATLATEPTTLDGAPLAKDKDRINESGDSGAWAYSSNVRGLVNVRIAP